MTRRLVSGIAAGFLAAAVAHSVAAQGVRADPRGYVPGPAHCDPMNCGYVIDSWNNPTNNVVRSGTYNGAMGLAGNLCWRQGTWTPAMAALGYMYGNAGRVQDAKSVLAEFDTLTRSGRHASACARSPAG